MVPLLDNACGVEKVAISARKASKLCTAVAILPSRQWSGV
jgi:hypothetical protein